MIRGVYKSRIKAGIRRIIYDYLFMYEKETAVNVFSRDEAIL